MTQPQIELKACPNPECNEDAPELIVVSMGENGWMVACPDCAMTGPQASVSFQAAAKWNALPRSSPHVAPGLRDFAEWLWKLQADYLTAGAYQERETVLYVTDELLKRIGITETDVVADIAAAQGGTVVDRERIRKTFQGIVDSSDKMEEFSLKVGDTNTNRVHYVVKKMMTKIIEMLDRGEFSAVPSAPDGVGRVKAALKEFGWPQSGYGQPWRNLYDAIEALGTPQGSDLLRWTAELPVKPGWYWWSGREFPVEIKCADDPRGTLYVVIDKQSDTYFPVENGLRGSWSYIPEPAQPVDAGEAKERGDNE